MKVMENVPDWVRVVVIVWVSPKSIESSPSSKPTPCIVIVVPTEPLSGDLRVRYAGVMKKVVVRLEIVIVFVPALWVETRKLRLKVPLVLAIVVVIV